MGTLEGRWGDSCRGVEKLAPGGPRMGGGGCWARLWSLEKVPGWEGQGGQGSESRTPRGYKTWKLPKGLPTQS